MGIALFLLNPTFWAEPYETGHDGELWKYSALRGMTLEEMSHLVHTFLEDQQRGDLAPV